ncbi:MAG TPA: hypothetical protein VNL37_00765 [Candidatus Polarisedimenticolia bacterium]|nr:hypothetical protein [Candidatus Polarisedimenticolia bacterium]
MFLGHEALALASRRLAPRPSLGTLVAAATLPDLLWPVFLLLGWEKVRIDPGNTVVTPLDFVRYPYTHSLLAVLLWAVLFGGLYGLLRRDRRGAVVCGLLVVSHWVLDFISHRPDLPLIPGGPRYGLGLWNSLPATLVAEGALYACGVWIYVRARPARDRTGVAAFWSVVILLAVLYVLSVWGPPPPDARAIAWVGLAGWIFPFWFAWADRHRRPA